MSSKVYDEIADPFPNFNGAAGEPVGLGSMLVYV